MTPQNCRLVPVRTGAQIKAAEEPLLDASEGPALMRRAAYGLAQHVLGLLKSRGGVYGAKVAAVVGSGNNGGDALYALAMLRRRGVEATAVLVGRRSHEEGREALRAAGGRILGEGPAAAEALAPSLSAQTDVLIDAVLGTGARGEFRLPEVEGLDELAHSSRCLTVACDIPSGVDADTGEATGDALAADWTVTFGGIKQGLLVGAGGRLSGEIRTVDIGLGKVGMVGKVGTGGEDLPQPVTWMVGEPETSENGRGETGSVPRRITRKAPEPADHKYSRGVLHAVVGSEQYPGAAQLTVSAAVSAGLGMVTVGAPASVCRRITMNLPEVVAGSSASAEFLNRATAAVAGPGIGEDSDQIRALHEVLDWAGSEHPAILDASALDQLGTRQLAEGGLSPNVLLTPHAGEFRRLAENAGREDLTETLTGDPISAVRGLADHLDATVLLKGATTIIAEPRGNLALHRAVTPGLATAGSGDVLSGLLGTLAANDPQQTLWRTAALGAALHADAAGRIDPHGQGRFGASALV